MPETKTSLSRTDTFSSISNVSFISDTEDEEMEGNLYVEELVEIPNADLPKDVYGMALCSFARDTYFLSESIHEGEYFTSVSLARVGRMCTSAFVLVFVIFVQVFLLIQTKHYVCAKEVHDSRLAYSDFQHATYQCTGNDGALNTSNCILTGYGHYRGLDAARPDLETMHDRLVRLGSDEEGSICRIPMTQPVFFCAIVLLWSLVCLQDIKEAFLLLMDIYCTKGIPAMKEALDIEHHFDDDGDHHSREVIIIGLTVPVKVVMSIILLTRAVIAAFLLFVGCRWLLATDRFVDLILNAVALEFILAMKDIMHSTIAPFRNVVELGLTKLATSPPTRLRPGCFHFSGTLLVLACSVLWAYIYVFHWQDVLPDYRWDAHEVCSEFIQRRYDVSASYSSYESASDSRRSSA